MNFFDEGFVIDEKVSIVRAENVYGVIVDKGNTVDENMTIQKRNAMVTETNSA